MEDEAVEGHAVDGLCVAAQLHEAEFAVGVEPEGGDGEGLGRGEGPEGGDVEGGEELDHAVLGDADVVGDVADVEAARLVLLGIWGAGCLLLLPRGMGEAGDLHAWGEGRTEVDGGSGRDRGKKRSGDADDCDC